MLASLPRCCLHFGCTTFRDCLFQSSTHDRETTSTLKPHCQLPFQMKKVPFLPHLQRTTKLPWPRMQDVPRLASSAHLPFFGEATSALPPTTRPRMRGRFIIVLFPEKDRCCRVIAATRLPWLRIQDIPGLVSSNHLRMMARPRQHCSHIVSFHSRPGRSHSRIISRGPINCVGFG